MFRIVWWMGTGFSKWNDNELTTGLQMNSNFCTLKLQKNSQSVLIYLYFI